MPTARKCNPERYAVRIVGRDVIGPLWGVVDTFTDSVMESGPDELRILAAFYRYQYGAI